MIRTTKNKAKTSIETSFYLSTKQLSATKYCTGIRGHWSIENSLHYVKDVTFKEDLSKTKNRNAVINKSIILNLVLNFFRKLNYKTIPQAVRLTTGNFNIFKQLLE